MAIPKNMRLIYCKPIYPRGGTIDLLITDDKEKGAGDISSLFSVSNIVLDIKGHSVSFNVMEGVLHGKPDKGDEK